MIHVLTACGVSTEFVEAELTAKLETPITLNFSELRASDLAGRSRAYKQLIEAGMTDQQASIISGFD